MTCQRRRLDSALPPTDSLRHETPKDTLFQYHEKIHLHTHHNSLTNKVFTMTIIPKLKHILLFACATLLTSFFVSCDDRDVELPEIGGDGVLTISTGGFSRASDGHYPDDENAEANEEAIKRVILFFFDKADTKAPAFFIYETTVDRTCTADLSIRIPATYIDSFADGNDASHKKGYVYALVNAPSALTVDTQSCKIGTKDATLDNILNAWVEEKGFVESASFPNGFVMRGDGEVEVTLDTNNRWKVTGYIPLERLASKVRLFVELPDIVYIDADGNTMEKEDGETDAAWEERKQNAVECWTPEKEMKLYFYNAATKGRIDAFIDTDNRDAHQLMSVTQESSDNVIRPIVSNPTLNDADKFEKYTYSHTVPYYSYPNKWESNTPTEEFMSYVVVELPWERQHEGGKEIRRCYYQVPVNAMKAEDRNIEANCLEANHYYRIKIRLGSLGSRDFGSPMGVDGSCEALKWGSANVDVSIKGKRYLVVNQKNWTMNNESYLEIPFSTSHKTKIEECYVTFFRYNDVWGTDPNARPDLLTYDPENHKVIYKDNTHNKSEFQTWLLQAAEQLKEDGGVNGEGVVELKNLTDGKKGDVLYYKKEYFYDEYYGTKLPSESKYNDYAPGFRYYVGHEHPITFHPDHIDKGSSAAWTQFTERYGIEKVYTCDIDHDRSVIMLNHPLIQMETIRNNDGEITGYEPALNPMGRLWEEYSRVEIVIKIRHEDWDSWKDDHLYVETVYITQYPGIYITVSHDYAEVGSTGNKYILVNGRDVNEQNRVTERADFNMVENEIGNNYAGNTNPNMYLIHTTQLNEDYNNYEIGDPRAINPNNFLSALSYYSDNSNFTNARNPNYIGDGRDGVDPLPFEGYSDEYKTWSGRRWGKIPNISTYSYPVASAPRIYDGSTGLVRYYYPTDESSLKENYIAPTFRIASSYGRTTINGRAEMRRRCASYQEAGRPAGRWRVPTKAEIRYIAQLSADGKIPILFGSTISRTQWGYYWSAQGCVQVNALGQVEGSEGNPGYPIGTAATRCVYDEWYWNRVDGGEFPVATREDGPLTRTFFWGDSPKDNTQPAKATP